MGIALGVGLTSACTFSCKHCYSGGGVNPVEIDTSALLRFISALPVDSVNLGTGESCFHPEFHEVLAKLHDLSIPVAVTTAGPSIEALSDREIALLHDVDFSLDFPERNLHDDWRAQGAYQMVTRGIERCRSLGVTASVAMCLMEQNAEYMPGMCDLCSELGVSLRVNVYKAIRSGDYQPSYSSFWKAVEVFFSSSKTALSSEPIVNAALAAGGGLMPDAGGSPCGNHSLRLRPGGEILPCVYWDTGTVTMEDVLSRRSFNLPECTLPVPSVCRDCPYLDICMGGCSGRRLYTGVDKPDIYCFRTGDRSLPGLTLPVPAKGAPYIHSSYLCTMIAEFD